MINFLLYCGQERLSRCRVDETQKSILQKRDEDAIIRNMGKQKLVEYFEEVETNEEYNGYFCSIPEAISIVVLGSICGLRNTSQIHQWAESEKVAGFLKEKFGIDHIPCYRITLADLQQCAANIVRIVVAAMN